MFQVAAFGMMEGYKFVVCGRWLKKVSEEADLFLLPCLEKYSEHATTRGTDCDRG